MAKRRLQRSQRGAPRNMGPTATAGHVPLKTPQWCMHQPGAKCVQANTFPCRAANFPCMSGWPSYNCRNPGPYVGAYYIKAHNQCEKKHRGGPRISPNPLPGHRPGHILPRCTVVITQRPPNSRQVAWLTGALWHRPRGPSAHQYRRPRPCHTGGCQERQKKFKLRTTNGRSNRVTQSSRQPWQWRHTDGKYWR